MGEEYQTKHAIFLVSHSPTESESSNYDVNIYN